MFFNGVRMDDYSSQILALLGNFLFFGVNILVTCISFAVLSVTLRHLGFIEEKPSENNLKEPISDSSDEFLIEISEADLIDATDSYVPELKFEFFSNNVDPVNLIAFAEPEVDETFLSDESDEDGFNVDGMKFFESKKVEPEKFVLKLVRCEDD